MVLTRYFIYCCSSCTYDWSVTFHSCIGRRWCRSFKRQGWPPDFECVCRLLVQCLLYFTVTCHKLSVREGPSWCKHTFNDSRCWRFMFLDVVFLSTNILIHLPARASCRWITLIHIGGRFVRYDQVCTCSESSYRKNEKLQHWCVRIFAIINTHFLFKININRYLASHACITSIRSKSESCCQASHSYYVCIFCVILSLYILTTLLRQANLSSICMGISPSWWTFLSVRNIHPSTSHSCVLYSSSGFRVRCRCLHISHFWFGRHASDQFCWCHDARNMPLCDDHINQASVGFCVFGSK